jgi:hypothetical protein
MGRKSLGTCVLLLGLLLGTSSSAYADAVAITSVTLSNIQLTPTSGTIVFSPPQSGPRTAANAVAINGFGEEDGSNQSESLTRSESSASVTFANANAVSDFTNLLVSANSSVMLSGCLCDAEAEGLAILRTSFMVIGGTGNVDVLFTGLVQSIQDLATDQLSLFAASDVDITMQVAGVNVFSFDPRLRLSGGFNDSDNFEVQRQLSQILNLQFGQQYDIDIFVRANSRAAQNEIPEPATVVLLASGLGLTAGFMRKLRAMRVQQ